MKLKLSKKSLRLAAYGIIVGGFALAGIICFGISQYQKAKYQSSNDVVNNAKKEYNKATKKDDAESLDKQEWYGDILDEFEPINNENSNNYKVTAVPAYILTTLSLVAFGLCLKHADMVKQKEEKDD